MTTEGAVRELTTCTCSQKADKGSCFEQGVKSTTVRMLMWEKQLGRSSAVWPQLFLQDLPPLPELVDPLDLLTRLWGPHRATDNQRSQPHD